MDENLEWQKEAKFLSLPEAEWPVKAAKELAATARESIGKMQNKAFVAVLTRARAKEEESKLIHGKV